MVGSQSRMSFLKESKKKLKVAAQTKTKSANTICQIKKESCLNAGKVMSLKKEGVQMHDGVVLLIVFV